MIVFDEDGRVVAHGIFTMVDVFRAYEHIPPIRKKIVSRLRKELGISRFNIYPFETYYATKIFIYFFRQVLKDIMFNKVRYVHSQYKSLFLRQSESFYYKRSFCRKYDALPSMPIFEIVLRAQRREKVAYKHIFLYNELQEEFKIKTLNGELSAGIKQDKKAEDYYDYVYERFPTVPRKIIRKIIKDGFSSLYYPVSKRRADLVIQDLDNATKRICIIKNQNSYVKNTSLYAQFTKFTNQKKDKSYYMILDDEQHQKVVQGEKMISGVVVHTFLNVKFMVKKTKSFKHIYKIKNSTRLNYQNQILYTNVKTSRLQYIFRRIDSRYEPIVNTEHTVN